MSPALAYVPAGMMPFQYLLLSCWQSSYSSATVLHADAPAARWYSVPPLMSPGFPPSP